MKRRNARSHCTPRLWAQPSTYIMIAKTLHQVHSTLLLHFAHTAADVAPVFAKEPTTSRLHTKHTLHLFYSGEVAIDEDALLQLELVSERVSIRENN